MSSSMTSVRLTAELSERLAKVAHHLHRGKNWVISKALENYCAQHEKEDFIAQARREVRLVAEAERKARKIKSEYAKELEEWENNADTTGWK